MAESPDNAPYVPPDPGGEADSVVSSLPLDVLSDRERAWAVESLDQLAGQLNRLEGVPEHEADDFLLSRFRSMFDRPQDYPGRAGLVVGSALLFRVRTPEAFGYAERHLRDMSGDISEKDRPSGDAFNNLLRRQQHVVDSSGDERIMAEGNQVRFVNQLIEDYEAAKKLDPAVARDALLFLLGAGMGLAATHQNRHSYAEAAMKLL